jgi:hypothetical protein
MRVTNSEKPEMRTLATLFAEKADFRPFRRFGRGSQASRDLRFGPVAA